MRLKYRVVWLGPGGSGPGSRREFGEPEPALRMVAAKRRAGSECWIELVVSWRRGGAACVQAAEVEFE